MQVKLTPSPSCIGKLLTEGASTSDLTGFISFFFPLSKYHEQVVFLTWPTLEAGADYLIPIIYYYIIIPLLSTSISLHKLAPFMVWSWVPLVLEKILHYKKPKSLKINIVEIRVSSIDQDIFIFKSEKKISSHCW